jgi:hypothetical protein
MLELEAMLDLTLLPDLVKKEAAQIAFRMQDLKSSATLGLRVTVKVEWSSYRHCPEAK